MIKRDTDNTDLTDDHMSICFNRVIRALYLVINIPTHKAGRPPGRPRPAISVRPHASGNG